MSTLDYALKMFALALALLSLLGLNLTKEIPFYQKRGNYWTSRTYLVLFLVLGVMVLLFA